MARPYEEVVIDGDTSTDDDDADVLVVTPQSRKRRRQSAIHDDEDEGEASQPMPPPQGGPRATTNAIRSNANGSNANNDDDDDDGDDDEVEIIQISTPSSAESKKRKAKLAVLDSDDEVENDDDDDVTPSTRSMPTPRAVVQNTLELAPVRRLSSGATPQGGARDRQETASSSSGRRSSRIERKRQEKASGGPSARKLEFLSLDNCLEELTTNQRRTAAEEEDDDDAFIVDEEEEEEASEEEEEDAASRRRHPQWLARRIRSPPPTSRQFADGDDDLDEFIVDDDKVEYMDEDDEGVMEQPMSSADEMDPEADLGDVRLSMQSREPSEWFSIYLRYLEEAILDDELDIKMRAARRTTEYSLFLQATHHIERAICSRRDALRSSIVWDDDIMEHLHCATRFHSTRCTATTDCQACRRANHYATQLVQFGGFACDSTELYKTNWLKKLRLAVREMEPMRASFELGTVCHARTLGYWQLLHAKHFWVALVDAKRRESGDGHGRIAEDARGAFYKTEYGRYKRLLDIVDKFSNESGQSVSFMPNVWKKVTHQSVHSEFLPSPALRSASAGNGARRGTMDSLVGESGDDNDETEDEEIVEEEEEEEELEEKRPVPSRASTPEQTDEAPVNPPTRILPRKRMRQSSVASAFPTNNSSPSATGGVKNELQPSLSDPAVKSVSEVEAEDLICLVCRQNQRDGAIAHGNYLHFYACYRCAKRQHAAKHGCMVCDRPIDNVLRILPLSKESRADIMKQQESN